MTIPTYLPYFVFAGTAATVFAILYGLNRALADAAWPAADRTRAVSRLGRCPAWLARSIDRARGDGRLPCGRKRHPHDPVRHRAADPDRQLADLAIGDGGTRHRGRAATMARRRTALSCARRDLSHPLRDRKAARPLRLAGRRWRHRHRPARSGRRPRLCASPARDGGPSSGHGTCSASWISSLPSRPAS